MPDTSSKNKPETTSPQSDPKCLQKLLVLIKKLLEKVNSGLRWLDSWGIWELVDFVKDSIYTINYPHQSMIITILLWVSLLFTVVYSTLKVAFMTLEEHIREYGLSDFQGKERE